LLDICVALAVRDPPLFVAARAAPQLADPRPPIYDLPAEAFACEITRLNGTPAEVLVQEELMSLMMLLRADFAVCETYRYTGQPPLECPISAFAGLRDSGVSPAVVAEWASQTTSRFRFRLIEGDQFLVQKAAATITAGIAEDLLDTTRIQEGAGAA
jgi:medium-chain acyl-[acyl-carrier-protein] hydrolase